MPDADRHPDPLLRATRPGERRRHRGAARGHDRRRGGGDVAAAVAARTPMTGRLDGDGVVLHDGDEVVAEGTATTVDVDVPPALSLAEPPTPRPRRRP